MHLLDAISPGVEDEAVLHEHSKYFNDLSFKNILCQQNGEIQWRSEGGQGGGHLPPGAAQRGAPKSCQGIFKNLYKEKFLKFWKNKMKM